MHQRNISPAPENIDRTSRRVGPHFGRTGKGVGTTIAAVETLCLLNDIELLSSFWGSVCGEPGERGVDARQGSVQPGTKKEISQLGRPDQRRFVAMQKYLG
jgi:hypothetical protein